ncbi:NAD(P)-binding protein [Aspergillus homomorphus CBS 101889]|uniref:NAD(P)-binding protein n=1 Tax=Aspergillus homomorphus (strain CBS 101889) TaxID=1450537 RepID=A0A395HWV4_ASPHC|nr:NAD(P)-binding protein [Aspergillus homomorphus CBS 101889]RAL11989.1 NAD(P)-binding protein [Aspergillus homomorphus CBS 101889]
MLTFLHNQLFKTPNLPPNYPETFHNRTIIITGANTGLGLATAHHLARCRPKRLILAVRNPLAGESAKAAILAAGTSTTTSTSTTDPSTTPKDGDMIEIWPLDLTSSASVLSFASRAEKSLGQGGLDVLVCNAGVATRTFSMVEGEEGGGGGGKGHERTVLVNVISTFLLVVLLVPVLRRSGVGVGRDLGEREGDRGAKATATPPVISIVGSEVHAFTMFPERRAPEEKGVGVFEALDRPDMYYGIGTMAERYPTSKLLDVLLARELAVRVGERIEGQEGQGQGQGRGIVVNCVNPGLCRSELTREADSMLVRVGLKVLGRTCEVGARTLVAGAAGGWESHGQYMSNGVVCPSELSAFVCNEEGRSTQRRVWEELTLILEGIKPGVMDNLL